MERMPPSPNYSHTYDNKRNQKKNQKNDGLNFRELKVTSATK